MRSSQVERTEPLGWAIDVFITGWKDKYTGGYFIDVWYVGKNWSMVWRGHLWLLCGLSEIWLFWVLSGALISTERPTRAHFSCWRSKLVQGAGTRKGSIDKRQKTRFNAEDKINKPNPPRWIRFTQPLHWNFNWGWGGGKKKGLMQELGVKGGRKEERSRRWLRRAG